MTSPRPMPSFPQFFHALWDREPFPWQTMLAERVAAGEWPETIGLPTASGKTACMDIAVWALAAQAERPAAQRTAPRRVWFVVDRRIVVDETFDRASELARKLADDTVMPIRLVADRLLALRGLPSRERPLAVGRLRGGVLRDDRWARIPSQAAVLASTVDQLGSRLLFRSYGDSLLTAPVYAGLAGNDSLVLLDEAHCAMPFLQTLRAVRFFRGAQWSEVAPETPFHVAVLSATPPEDGAAMPCRAFPADAAERQCALNHPVLQDRLSASKLAVLETCEDEAQLVSRLAAAAVDFARSGHRRIGVIVNRVGRAMEVSELLRTQARKNLMPDTLPEFDVHVLTGRIRPFERDALVEQRLKPIFHSRVESPPERPTILVSTQCLEVGADFSFDALVSEFASLDALRQRFGRLDRLGLYKTSPACILVAESSLKDDDPIYGAALAETWEFLNGDIATVVKVGKKRVRRVDFGVNALEDKLPAGEALRALSAPSSDAPVMLPAHLDLLCQTAPPPHPEPDVALFLHGKGRGSPEVRVLWRCDLDTERPDEWRDIMGLCRPVAAEMLSVPLHRLRQWLQDRAAQDQDGDIEGVGPDGNDAPAVQPPSTPFLLWRGRDRSEVLADPRRIPPGSVVVLPAPARAEQAAALGQILQTQGMGRERLDLWEFARSHSGQPSALRLTRASLAPWAADCPPLHALLDLAVSADWRIQELRDGIAAVRDWTPADDEEPALPECLRRLFAAVADVRKRDVLEHPGGGLVLRARAGIVDARESDLFADDDETASETPDAVPLADHIARVACNAEALASACLGADAAPIFGRAGFWHDAGKLDSRFQTLLHGGAPSTAMPLAKSPDLPRSAAQAQEIRRLAELPDEFRHEMLSLQLAERFLPGDLPPADRELLLHLIAAHHGHARPFAPVCLDADPPAVCGAVQGTPISLDAGQRGAMVPPHRLDAGVSERFWTLVRRCGWWGLAYREAILRLADWHASAHPRQGDTP